LPIPPHKRPSAIADFALKKQPASEPVPEYGQMNPAWRISRLEMREPFGWHEVDEATLHEIREKLRWFESMTINQIFVVSRKLNHPVALDKLCTEARKRLAELRLDDLDELHTLHLSGVKRVWGILSGNVLSLLWWDPNHQVCPSIKRHT